jgi:hypothetical protein
VLVGGRCRPGARRPCDRRDAEQELTGDVLLSGYLGLALGIQRTHAFLVGVSNYSLLDLALFEASCRAGKWALTLTRDAGSRTSPTP